MVCDSIVRRRETFMLSVHDRAVNPKANQETQVLQTPFLYLQVSVQFLSEQHAVICGLPDAPVLSVWTSKGACSTTTQSQNRSRDQQRFLLTGVLVRLAQNLRTVLRYLGLSRRQKGITKTAPKQRIRSMGIERWTQTLGETKGTRKAIDIR